MTGEDLKWLIGATVGIVLAFVAAIRRVATKASEGDKVLHKKIDEIKRDYVRRDDMKDFMSRTEKRLDEIQKDSRTAVTEIAKLTAGATLPKD